MALAIAPLFVALASCTRPEPDTSDVTDTVLFSIRIALSGNDSFASPSMSALSRAGEQLPDNDMEKLHTLRIVILDGDGKVEANVIWDLTSAPAAVASGEPFKVKGDDSKTVIFVGNEGNTVIQTSDGRECTVSEYFSRLYVGLGDAAVTADIDEIRHLILPRDKNSFFGSNTTVPIPINAIYDNIEIPNTTEVVSRDFWLHRAVAKYTFRIKYDYSDIEVPDPEQVQGLVESVTVSNVADRQYYFPVAEFGSPLTQFPLRSYTAPTAATSESQTVDIGRFVALKSTLTVTPYYVPEGPVLSAASPPYWVKARINGRDSDRKDIIYGDVENPVVTSPMLDLPRNHHVVVDGSFDDAPDCEFTINISVCRWNEQTIDIPEYN